ncbi:OLC1v1016749C1 [Oldenlandia corymbosa var. corymbosa]|uniref:OLC1v1016749C1 n=1 Tax=Oldenlandia corymbosa var. corymbosa TaxID=529605 RepID=A0AAV1E7U9_OLDCO|nr:OLC1v1016749C1 [Oldenlandia corymbosa var. corymbosa]
MATEEENRAGFGSLQEGITHRILSFLSEDDKQTTRDLSEEWSDAVDTYPTLSFDPVEVKDVENTLLRHTFGGIPLPYQLKIVTDFIPDDHADVDPARLDKWLTTAVGNGVRELILSIGCCPYYCCPSNYIIPDCILGAKSLTMLSLTNCKFPDKLKAQQILCKNLHTLMLRNVSISNDILSSLIMSCPLIEHLGIENCKDLDKAKLINIPCLKELHIGHFQCDGEDSLRVEIDAPNLKAAKFGGSCGLHFVEGVESYRNLQKLMFMRTTLSNLFFDNVVNKLSHLRSLAVISCNGFAEFNLTSNSLEKFEFKPDVHDLPAQQLKVNSRSLIDFHLCLLYVNVFPRVSFISFSPQLKTEVSIFYDPDRRDKSWFPRMEDTLSGLAPSKISLHIEVKSEFQLDENVLLEESSTGFADSFLACCPETIILSLSINERTLCIVNCLQRKLEEKQDQDLIRGFKWFVVHCGSEKCQQQTLDLMSLSAECCTRKMIWFALGWNSPSCSSNNDEEPTDD